MTITQRFTAGLLPLLAAGTLLGAACPAWAQGDLVEENLDAPETVAAEAYDDLAQFDMLRRFGLAEPKAKAAGAVRVATYNVENLFDAHNDPQLSGDNEDIDDEKPVDELRAVARAIRMLDADVLCLQEIESESALIEFRDTYLAGMGYEHVASIDAGTGRGIEQSVLSRFPITSATNRPQMALGGVHPELYGTRPNWNAGEPLAFRRSPLIVDVDVPGVEGSAYSLTLVVVHHKSGRHAGYWREAEAKGVLGVLEELDHAQPERNLLVLGDFNAQASDSPVRTYLDAGFADLGPTGGSAGVTHESGRRIDLILGTPGVAEDVVEGSAFVLGTPARPAGVNWRDVPTFPGYAADHYPVAIDLIPDDR
ncbi:MAG: endonuclease/exonuclease/phosphatase family protein [Planctomycetota bacterium]